MKKLISILLATIMLFSGFVVSVSAYDEDRDVSHYKYYDKMVEYVGEYFESEIRSVYDEVYYHYSQDNPDEPDWTLIFCGFSPQPIEAKYGTLVGERILSVVGGGCGGFVDGYGVYIREMDLFLPLRQNQLELIVALCPDFEESIVENEIGQQFGDVDDDGLLTVLDATYIQRYLAEYYDFIQTYFVVTLDGGSDYVLTPDIDRDGATTVMDATAIQRKLAGIDDTPQPNEELVLVEYKAPLYSAPYPEKPNGCTRLYYDILRSRQYYGYYPDHLGINDNYFLAVIKSKEQYQYVFEKYFGFGFDDEFYEKYWVVASYVREGNERMSWEIDEVSVLGDTLYVNVELYESAGDSPVNPAIPSFVSVVAIEKEKLANVTNIVRVDK